VNWINISTPRLNKTTTPPFLLHFDELGARAISFLSYSASKPTRAVTLVIELIREAIPVKSPTIPIPAKCHSGKDHNCPTKKPARKPRAVSVQSPTEEKQAEMSMQAITVARCQRCV